MQRAGGKSRVLVTGSMVVLLLGGSGAVADDTRTLPVPRPLRTVEDEIPDLKRARLAARMRLGDPRCQAVLADFRSVTGRRLDEVLAARGRTAQEQLDLLRLESGLGRHVCSRPGTLASTSVHSSSVSICLRTFLGVRPLTQEAILIHEMLHSLGLGENPPDSVTITEQVLRRCGG